MDWRVKATVQAVLAAVPGGVHANELLQRYAGGRAPRHLRWRARLHLSQLRNCVLPTLRSQNVSLAGAEVLEIGTGFEPTFAMCLSGLGARVTTIDVRRSLKASRYLREFVRRIWQSTGDELLWSPAQERGIRAFFSGSASVTELLACLGVRYLAPVADEVLLDLPPRSFDLVFSISVLPHVRPEGLEAIMRGQRHVLRPSGLAYHYLGLEDNFALIDHGITPLNYLRYDGPLWRWLGENEISYQNRLRKSDYDRLFAAHDFETLVDQATVDEPTRQLLLSRRLPLAGRFRAYDVDDLATLQQAVVLTPRPRAAAVGRRRPQRRNRGSPGGGYPGGGCRGGCDGYAGGGVAKPGGGG
ncbi:MAG TPA: class I SAM-dependent methyltransferase [Polyangia bacterium]|jgi:SAM-dependent methyltransferase